MFPIGSITFHQLNILFLTASITAVIFLLIIILVALKRRILKRDHLKLVHRFENLKIDYKKLQSTITELEDNQLVNSQQTQIVQLTEEKIEQIGRSIEKRILTKIMELMRGIKG